jgi:hypothetical protein
MEPTPVRIGMMDSTRPGLVVTLPARHLSGWERFRRAFGRMMIVSTIALVISNFMLLIVPAPHVHLCSLPLSIIIGPLVAYVVWRERVLLGATEIACARCRKPVAVPQDHPGWPARMNCLHCGIMVELTLATPG